MSPATEESRPAPVFEMVVLGSGGGPLETDTSGYLVKPYKDKWEDGILALEGGSGVGALATLFEYRDPATIFPSITFPPTHNTPVLRAAYVFSFLTCYLVTHAHLDHCLSLILLSGSVPPKPTNIGTRQTQVPLSPPPTAKSLGSTPVTPVPTLPRPPVYATRYTLERLSMAYGGELWPELGSWAPERLLGHKSKKRKVESGPTDQSAGERMDSGSGTGVTFTPITPDTVHRPLNPNLPFTIRKFHVAHGCTSKGAYESSAMFIRHDPSVTADSTRESSTDISTPPVELAERNGAELHREFLFFGDLESDFRSEGEEEWDVAGRDRAKNYNEPLWEEAGRSWNDGRLAAIFIECSYDSDRPAHLMFGHISPPGLYHELRKLAALAQDRDEEPLLDGLRVYITHIKDELIPHPTGQTARERIMRELRALEVGPDGGLGVDFVELKKGDRLVF